MGLILDSQGQLRQEVMLSVERMKAFPIEKKQWGKGGPRKSRVNGEKVSAFTLVWPQLA